MLARVAQELKGYLRQGITLDELWRVARGEVKYADFAASRQGGQGGNGAAVAAPPSIPDELARPPAHAVLCEGLPVADCRPATVHRAASVQAAVSSLQLRAWVRLTPASL